MPEKTGKVWLVGAGPSDAGLITMRGFELLKRADVVVYDRLLGSGILSMFPDNAKKIDVGKTPDKHPVSQREINQILVREALAGNRVVRLKGGDPFLFGRGGEELEELVKQKIPYEIVPGITSAIAAPAYAGIPVTHRDYSSSLHIFTGHFSEEKEQGIDYATITKLKGTLVFLMGVAAAGRICNGLIKAGMAKDMPAAVIEQGTSARQRTYYATLATLTETINKEGVHSPAVILIGKTATIGKRFSWVSNRPLHGKRIIVTRPHPQSEAFCQKICSLGGEIIAFPCIETVAVHNGKIKESIKHLSEFHWITFSSATGVNIFFDTLYGLNKDSRTLSGVQIAAVGTATAKCLTAHGIHPDFIPEKFDGAHLGAALSEKVGSNDKLLVVRAKNGSKALEKQLLNAHIHFEAIDAYETHSIPQSKTDCPEIRKMIINKEFDLVTFTSASTVRGFVENFPHLEFPLCTAVCIGPETAAEAKKQGFSVVVSPISTMEGMLKTMIDL